MAMTEARRNEIAMALVRMTLTKEGIRFRSNADMRRRLGENLVHPEFRKIKLTIEEAVEFVKPILQEALDEMFDLSAPLPRERGRRGNRGGRKHHAQLSKLGVHEPHRDSGHE